MSMCKVSRHWALHGRLLLVLAAMLLSQDAAATFIRIRPNTYKEFQFIRCQGKFDKEQYSALTRICDDCYNVYRDPEVLIDCKADCFQNNFFPKCVSQLLLDSRGPEFKKMIYTVSGQKPLMYSMNGSNAMASFDNQEI